MTVFQSKEFQSFRQGERKKIHERQKMFKQPLPVPTANAVGICPTVLLSKLVCRSGTRSLPNNFAPSDHPRSRGGSAGRSIMHTPGSESVSSPIRLGWSGDAMVLGKLPVLGGPTNLDKSRARAYYACSRCG